MMKQARVHVALGALLALFLCPTVFAQNGDGVENPPAATLTPRIKTALVASTAALKGSNINVDTVLEKRIVILSGTVLSNAQKMLAGNIARRNAGGFQVQNRLEVRAEHFGVQQSVPAKFERPFQFLQLLAKSQGRGETETFHDRVTPFPDVPHLLWFVSTRGVTIVDVNVDNGKALFLTRACLSHDLKRTKSLAFDSLAYVGYIFAMPYEQYSGLTFKPTGNGVVVEMPSGHRLTWEREKGLLQLRKLEYLKIEGD